MKHKIILLLASLALFSISSFAGGLKKEKIKVEGNCGMCEDRIESAAKSVVGVKSAEWYADYETIEVKFDPAVTSTEEIEKAIAKAGHDTENYKADKDVYNALPACCKYRD